jgi:hypothetical protein
VVRQFFETQPASPRIRQFQTHFSGVDKARWPNRLLFVNLGAI